MLDRSNYPLFHSLTPKEKELLTEHYLEQKRIASLPQDGEINRDPQWKSMEAERGLLLLGEPETIDPIVREFCEVPLKEQRYDVVRTLRLMADPKVIERLAPEMLKDEPFKRDPIVSDVIFNNVPKPYVAAQTMLMIVANSPAFDGNTRKWAEDNALLPLFMDTSPPHARAMDMVRQWWKENEQFFKTGDYKSVKPGEQLSAKIGEWLKKREKELIAGGSIKAAAENAAKERESDPPSPAAAATRSVATTGGGGGWGAFGYGLIGLLVLALLAALTFYGRSARHF